MLEGKKISELDQIDTLSLGSSFPVLDKGATKRIAFSALLNKIENELPESDIDKVKNDVEKLKVKTESINTLTTEMEAVKDQVSGVDEMVQGQNATIRNCVSAVEDLEQVIETTHFDDVLALEEQVHANTTNVEKKLNKTTDSANAGKAVVVDENGNLVFGAAGVQVSKAEGNAIEEKEDGIYVPLDLSGVPIGAPTPWLSDNLPVGFLAFDGSEYNISDYPELYNVVKNVPSFHSDTEGKFKIPNLKGRVLQGADTVIGELIEAGLPNIKGEIKTNDSYGAIQGYYPSGYGAYKVKRKGNAAWQGAVQSTFDLEFDASKGETKTDGTLKTEYEPHVYGNSDTVQPPAFTVRWIIKATNYESLEKNAIDDTKTTNANAWSAAKTQTEIDANHKYSTEEKVIGEWIDGKPIYRKAGRVASMGTGYVVIDPILTSSYIDSVVAMNATGISNSEIIQFGSYVGVTPSASLGVNVDGFRKLDGSPATTNFNWWIEYTKASD